VPNDDNIELQPVGQPPLPPLPPLAVAEVDEYIDNHVYEEMDF